MLQQSLELLKAKDSGFLSPTMRNSSYNNKIVMNKTSDFFAKRINHGQSLEKTVKKPKQYEYNPDLNLTKTQFKEHQQKIQLDQEQREFEKQQLRSTKQFFFRKVHTNRKGTRPIDEKANSYLEVPNDNSTSNYHREFNVTATLSKQNFFKKGFRPDQTQMPETVEEYHKKMDKQQAALKAKREFEQLKREAEQLRAAEKLRQLPKINKPLNNIEVVKEYLDKDEINENDYVENDEEQNEDEENKSDDSFTTQKDENHLKEEFMDAKVQEAWEKYEEQNKRYFEHKAGIPQYDEEGKLMDFKDHFAPHPLKTRTEQSLYQTQFSRPDLTQVYPLPMKNSEEINFTLTIPKFGVDYKHKTRYAQEFIDYEGQFAPRVYAPIEKYHKVPVISMITHNMVDFIKHKDNRFVPDPIPYHYHTLGKSFSNPHLFQTKYQTFFKKRPFQPIREKMVPFQINNPLEKYEMKQMAQSAYQLQFPKYRKEQLLKNIHFQPQPENIKLFECFKQQLKLNKLNAELKQKKEKKNEDDEEEDEKKESEQVQA